MSMSIDEAIKKLQELKEQANLKGDTVLHICLEDHDYITVKDLKVDNDPSGGSCLLVMGDIIKYDNEDDRMDDDFDNEIHGIWGDDDHFPYTDDYEIYGH